MRLPDSLTPLRIGLGLFVIVAAVVLFALWNPWSGYLRSRVAKAEAAQETAVDALQGQTEANLGQADVETAAQEVRVIVETVREVTHAVEIEARRAPNSQDPLEPDVDHRLRQSDERLCAIGPDVCRDGADSPAPGPDASE